jgi:molecular chaperone DnaK
MGRKHDEVSEEKIVPYEVVGGPNGDVRVDIDGKSTRRRRSRR